MSEPVLGIDLGTSNSVLATVDDGIPLVIPSRSGGWLTPSMVAVHDGAVVAGRPARELLDWFPRSVATATKRLLGRRFTPELAAATERLPYRVVGGPAEDVRVVLEDKSIPATEVSALVLGELFLDAQRYWGQPVRKAVITVPANFNDQRRQATKEAAAIAGFDLLRMLNEPTAAALAFGLARRFNGRALVFDLGGGTLDVTVLEVNDGVFEVQATDGHEHLGGEDFDALIVDWLLEQVPGELRTAASADVVSMRKLKTAAEKAKCELTVGQAAQIEVTGLAPAGAGTVRATLTRSEFDQLCQPLWTKCVEVCEQVLHQAHLQPTQIDSLLLVGGMTRVPRVRQLLAEKFQRAPEKGVSPDEVVALGAAIHAAEVGAGASETLLLDVAAHTLGVGYAGDRIRRLIPKNAAIPARAEQYFVPARAAQTQALIPVFQGEGDRGTDCTKLGEVRLTNLSGGDRADVPILVSFELATDGTLAVKAQHPNTGEVTTLTIHARTDLDVGELVRLREQHAQRTAAQTVLDRKASVEAFRELLAEGERLLAGEETALWAPTERSAFAHLMTLGREALLADNWERIATSARGLRRIMHDVGHELGPEYLVTRPAPTSLNAALAGDGPGAGGSSSGSSGQ